jgi:hypothetical protein
MNIVYITVVVFNIFIFNICKIMNHSKNIYIKLKKNNFKITLKITFKKISFRSPELYTV